MGCFLRPLTPLVIAEVEFPTEEEANAFIPPNWFLEDVTCNPAYHNSTLSSIPENELKEALKKYEERQKTTVEEI